jgi:hypothetical protein
MPYLSNIERRGLRKGRQEGREEGREEGLLEAIALGLELRFGQQALELLSLVRQVKDVERLRGLVVDLKTVPTLEAFAAAVGSGLKQPAAKLDPQPGGAE